jgi:hypothetical protein
LSEHQDTSSESGKEEHQSILSKNLKINAKKLTRLHHREESVDSQEASSHSHESFNMNLRKMTLGSEEENESCGVMSAMPNKSRLIFNFESDIHRLKSNTLSGKLSPQNTKVEFGSPLEQERASELVLMTSSMNSEKPRGRIKTIETRAKNEKESFTNMMLKMGTIRKRNKQNDQKKKKSSVSRWLFSKLNICEVPENP